MASKLVLHSRRRGFVFTMGALLVLLVFIVLSTQAALTPAPDSYPAHALAHRQTLAQDALLAMNASGALDSSMQTNSSAPLSRSLLALPHSECYQLRVLDGTGVVVNGVAASGCACADEQSVAFVNFTSILLAVPTPFTAQLALCERRAGV